MSSLSNSSNLPAEPAYPADGGAYPQPWQPAPPPASPGGEPWARYLAAARRYKWLILVVVLLGSAIGLASTRFVTRLYEVRGSIWLAEPVRPPGGGPVEASGERRPQTYSELAQSQALAVRIARQQRLYITPADLADSAVFAGFEPAANMRPGSYELRVDSTGTRYTLLNAKDSVVETGAVGDSVGRRVGFLWQPAPAALDRGRSIEFTAVTPRMAAASLVGRIKVTYPEWGNTLRFTMSGTDPQRAATTLNEYLRGFVAMANDLQRGQFNEAAVTLAQQLDSSERQLRAAEEALQRFRERTAGRAAPQLQGPGGIPTNQSPTLAEYFRQQTELEELRRQREAIEAALANPAQLSADVFATIPAAKETQDLHNALHELSEKQAELRAALRTLTDSADRVKLLRRDIAELRAQTIPPLARAVSNQLTRRERELMGQINRQTQELVRMPEMGTTEMRLVRELAAKNDLFQRVRSSYDQMRLAALSTPSQVRILDTAIAPMRPTSDSSSKYVLMAIFGSLAAGVGLAFLLDRTDRRFRYPEQATGELGLPILGVVPSIAGATGDSSPEAAAQVVEAFRTIRMNLRYALNGSGDPLMVTVSSPGPGDGKSLVSANLALSFAQAGCRVLLIDGDIRRGELHEMFDVARRPGLIDHLAGGVPLDAVLRETSHENLTLVPCGTRRHRGPELLQSEALNAFVDALRPRYEVIIADSAPLSAGIDAFALGAATGSMLVVLRSGETDRRMAQARLQLLQTLPIRVLGAVLNDITTDGAYRYYSYQYGYSMEDDEGSVPQLTARTGE